MTETTEQVDAHNIFPKIDKDIITRYESLLGVNGLYTFQKDILPLAKRVLRDKSDIYRQTLETLITVGTQYSPSNASDFWTNEVGEDAFTFQKDFDDLIRPCSVDLKPLGFHINTRRLLITELSEKRLIPAYIRKGDPYVDDEEDNPDYYRVSFASGNIEEVSKFLAGFALLYKAKSWPPKELEAVNSPQFPRSFAIAIADTSTVDTKYIPRGHDMQTQYSPEGNGEYVDLYISHQTIPIQIAEIPLTVLLPEQINKFREEGMELYKAGKFYTRNSNVRLRDATHAAGIYATAKHQELRIKNALLKVATTKT